MGAPWSTVLILFKLTDQKMSNFRAIYLKKQCFYETKKENFFDFS